MRCQILHESEGRIRVHMAMVLMEPDQADVLEYYLRACPAVTRLTVYERTADAVVFYTPGERETILKRLKSADIRDEEQ